MSQSASGASMLSTNRPPCISPLGWRRSPGLPERWTKAASFLLLEKLKKTGCPAHGTAPQPRSRGKACLASTRRFDEDHLVKSLKQRVYNAVKSGRLVRTPGTPAEKMTDFELTRFLMEHTPEPDIEYYLAVAYHGTRVEVSGTPAVSPDDSEDLIEKLTALAKKMGGRVRVAGNGLDDAPMDVTIYDGRSNGTRTHE